MRILCYGDSSAAGYGVEKKQVWTNQLQADFAFNMIFKVPPDDSVKTVLSLLPREIDIILPDVVALQAGSGDIFQNTSLESLQADIEEFCRITAKKGAIPVLCTPLPISRHKAEQQLAEYVYWLYSYAERKQVALVDFWSVFNASVWRIVGEELIRDDMHPSMAGHIVMASIFSRTMKELFVHKVRVRPNMCAI